MALATEDTTVASSVSGGKGGKGKGSPPPLPSKPAKPPQSSVAKSTVKVTVCDGKLKSGGETVVTNINGERTIERADGTVEVLKPQAFEDRPHNGILADPSWPLPEVAVNCDELARPQYRSGCAHEYLDSEDVLRSKVVMLSDMLRRAHHVVVYGGAGLSTSAGIPDWATRTANNGVLAQQQQQQQQDTVGKGKGKGKGKNAPQFSSFHAAGPSFGHRALAALANRGFIRRFIQQNHDGLPQKAGMPQRLVNEIHGGIFDPSNPVVKMSGKLRDDLFQDLLRCERTADLMITLGSSLSGMNSDRLVKTCAERAMRARSKGEDCLGSVIVSLQTTPHDAEASVRIYATIDRTMELLTEQLEVEVSPPETPQPQLPSSHRPLGAEHEVFEVPYDAEGRRLLDSQPRRQWDLRTRSIHSITVGPNKGARAIILGKLDGTDHYRVGLRLRPEFQGDWEEIRIMGSWWVNAAVAGDVETLPIMTRDETSLRE